jgi:signal transduction histidine kinase/integral membrane sensor domain MASE1
MPPAAARLSARLARAVAPLDIAKVAVLALIYLAAAKASLLLAIPPGYATAVWPPSGIALAALLLYGVRLWPGVWLGAALANVGVDQSVPLAGAIATGNTLEALCAWWLIGRLIGLPVRFAHPESVFRFAAAIVASSVVAAAIGVAALYASGTITSGAVLANGYTWWQGDTTGMMVLAPFLLAWLRRDGSPAGYPHTGELVIFTGLLSVTLIAVFAFAGDTSPDIARALTFLLIPFMAWAGSRFEERTVTAAILGVAAVAIVSTIHGHGPFPLASQNESLLLLQAFTSTVALMGLVLCALTQQRADSDTSLKQTRDRLEATVQERTMQLERKNRELATDIAQKQQLADILQRREAQLAEAQALTHVGSWSWDIESGRVAWSDELYRIYGVAPDAFEPSFEGYISAVHPDDRPRVMAAIDLALTRQQPWNLTERIIRPDGSIRVLKSLGKATADATGRTVGMHGVCLDYTETGRLEQIQAVHLEVAAMLVQAASWQEGVLSALSIVCGRLGWAVGAMWRVDEEAGCLRHACAWCPPTAQVSAFVELSQKMSFVPGRGLPGRTWEQRQPVWIEDVVNDANFPRASAAAQAGLHAAFALPLMAGGQVIGVMEFFSAEVRKPDQELLRMLIALASQLGEYIFRNQSQARVEALEEAGRQTREFLAMLGHELRNPLAPIRNAVSAMQAHPLADQALRPSMGIIDRQVTHLSRLVDDLLDVSRVTSGKIELRQEALDLRSVVARAIEASRALIDERGHTLQADMPEEAIEVMGDLIRLSQVLQNLLNNAAKFTPPGGRIELRLERKDGAALLGVRDSGIGIPSQLLSKVFGLFVQGDRGLDRTEGGLGIGLTLVREIVLLHGGRVLATSDGPGRGAHFVVHLPLLQTVGSTQQPPTPAEHATTGDEPSRRSATGSRTVPRRVLVVDDNADAADSMASLLRLHGHEAWTAYDAASALALGSEHRPDVVLLDIGLPGMSGYDVALKLRELPALRDALIIAVTGYGQPEDRRRSREVGFDHHLIKPVDIDALRRLME